MKHFCRFALLALIAIWPTLSPASASDLQLRNDVLASGGVVTVGDFFAHAGALAGRPLFRAPRRGASGVVQVYRLVDALAALKIDWRPPVDLREVRVHRVSETVDKKTIASAIAARIGVERPDLAAKGEIDIRLNQSARTIVIDGARQANISVEKLDITDARRSFRADLKITGASGRGATVRRTVRGRFSITQSVPVLARALRRGETITQADLTTRRQPVATRGNVVFDTALIVGQAARRSLPAGQPLRLTDIQTPRIVTKNQLVTIVFRAPGLLVTTKGRALGEGGRGDTVRVINVRSNKIIDAVAQAPGLVAVSPARPLTVASR